MGVSTHQWNVLEQYKTTNTSWVFVGIHWLHCISTTTFAVRLSKKEMDQLKVQEWWSCVRVKHLWYVKFKNVWVLICPFEVVIESWYWQCYYCIIENFNRWLYCLSQVCTFSLTHPGEFLLPEYVDEILATVVKAIQCKELLKSAKE